MPIFIIDIQIFLKTFKKLVKKITMTKDIDIDRRPKQACRTCRILPMCTHYIITSIYRPILILIHRINVRCTLDSRGLNCTALITVVTHIQAYMQAYLVFIIITVMNICPLSLFLLVNDIYIYIIYKYNISTRDHEIQLHVQKCRHYKTLCTMNTINISVHILLGTVR